jgi:hypothetical protein
MLLCWHHARQSAAASLQGAMPICKGNSTQITAYLMLSAVATARMASSATAIIILEEAMVVPVLQADDL